MNGYERLANWLTRGEYRMAKTQAAAGKALSHGLEQERDEAVAQVNVLTTERDWARDSHGRALNKHGSDTERLTAELADMERLWQAVNTAHDELFQRYAADTNQYQAQLTELNTWLKEARDVNKEQIGEITAAEQDVDLLLSHAVRLQWMRVGAKARLEAERVVWRDLVDSLQTDLQTARRHHSVVNAANSRLMAENAHLIAERHKIDKSLERELQEFTEHMKSHATEIRETTNKETAQERTIERQERRIAELLRANGGLTEALQKAQRNDPPKDPKTGRFVKRGK